MPNMWWPSACCTQKSAALTIKNGIYNYSVLQALDVLAIDILGPFSHTKSGNKYIIVITDHYSKLHKAIPTAKTTYKRTANIFIEY